MGLADDVDVPPVRKDSRESVMLFDLNPAERAVERGAKPRMRGRESCLFLEVDADGRTLSVML